MQARPSNAPPLFLGDHHAHDQQRQRLDPNPAHHHHRLRNRNVYHDAHGKYIYIYFYFWQCISLPRLVIGILSFYLRPRVDRG